MPSKKSLKFGPGYGLLPDEGVEMPVSVQAIQADEEKLWAAEKPAETGAFPPCIKAMLTQAAGDRGRHRIAAILAAFLGQAGFCREDALSIWSKATTVEGRIFEEWFLKMHCPKCRAMQRQSRGYPDLGVADLGLCLPDEDCDRFDGPVEYACRILSEEDRERGHYSHIKTRYTVRVFDWSSGKEGEIELTEKEKMKLEALLAEKADNQNKILLYARVKVRGRLRPRFYLKDQDGPRRQMLSDVI
jgi:hypothetical protein